MEAVETGNTSRS